VNLVTEREEPGVRGAGIPCADLLSWRSDYGLVAGVTTRGGPRGDFNVGLMTDEGAERVTSRWRELTESFRPEFSGITVSLQPHGTELRLHESPFDGWLILNGYDGHLTSQAGILLTVSVADCVPVYLAHPPTGSVALLHAGWRGVVAGIVERGIRRLADITGAEPGEFLMHGGVAIGETHYEVGPEVLEQLGVGPAIGPGRVDLRRIVAERAEAAGLRRITLSPWCTFQDSGHFWSHRRDPNGAGRMIAYLGRPLT
jgi:YfiH family protein